MIENTIRRYTFIDDFQSDQNKKTAKTVYYYRSCNSFIRAVTDFRDKEGSEEIKGLIFQATNIKFSNDAEEYRLGNKLFEKLYKKTFKSTEKIKDESEDIFMLCFTGKEDLLPMWNMYGGKSGVCIELNTEKTEYIQENFDIKDSNSLKPIKVFYELQKVKDEFERWYKQEDLGSVRYAASVLTPYIKDESFKDEDEYRQLIFNTVKSKIHYQETRNLIAPYIKVKIIPNSKIYEMMPTIRIGPGYNQNETVKTILHLLGDAAIEITNEDVMDLFEKKLVKGVSKKTVLNKLINDFKKKHKDKILVFRSPIPYRA